MKWLEPTLEQQTNLKNASWMSDAITYLLSLMLLRKVMLGEETYLYSRRFDRFDRLITMNSWIEFNSVAVAGMKWVSSRAANLAQGLPRGGAVSVLNDAETGMPLLAYEGSDISLARTAMVAMVATKALLKEPLSMTLVGAGRVHEWQASYARQMWPDIELYMYDTNRERASEFAADWSGTLLTDWREGLDADVFSLATAGTGSTGWISDREPIHVSGVWLNTSLRDIQPRFISRFPLAIVDDHSYAASQGTPYDFAWNEGWVRKEVSLPELVCGSGNYKDAGYPVLVNPMGLPVWDVGIGYLLFHEEFDYLKGRLTRDAISVI